MNPLRPRHPIRHWLRRHLRSLIDRCLPENPKPRSTTREQHRQARRLQKKAMREMTSDK